MAIYGPPINTAITIYLPLVTNNSSDWKGTPTIAAGDFQVSIDGGATFANPATLPSETAAGSKVVKVPLANGEVNAVAVIVRGIDQTATKEWQDTGEIIYTTASSGLDAAGVRAAVGLASANLDTQLSGIQSDTDNVQTRLPAALVGGRMDSSIGAMAANTLTASALATDAVTEITDAIPSSSNSQVQGGSCP